MKNIIILDCQQIKLPLVLKYVYDELLEAYTDHNYNVKYETDITKITDNDIVFMGDTFNVQDPQNLLYDIAPNAIYVGWYWARQNVNKLKYFICTGEYSLTPTSHEHVQCNKLNLLKNNYVPLLLRANEHPNKIGTYEKNIIYDYCYIGWPYNDEWMPLANFQGVYYAINDHTKYLSYNDRKNIYLQSLFALGFQSLENMQNSHVSQRIYEALAYGCVCFSNSKAAVVATQGIVVYVSDKEDLLEKMQIYKCSEKLIKKKQMEGYEFIKKYGTNRTSIQLINNCIYDNYQIKI